MDQVPDPSYFGLPTCHYCLRPWCVLLSYRNKNELDSIQSLGQSLRHAVTASSENILPPVPHVKPGPKIFLKTLDKKENIM